MENKINKIITVDNGSKFMIVDQGNYNGKCYFLTSKLDENDNLTEEFSILEETIIGDDKVLSLLDDEILLKALAKYFKGRIES